MVPLSPDTLARVEVLFRPEELEAVRALLENECADNLPFCDRSNMHDLERLRYAALKLSDGNFKRLQREVRQARLDWRDTLMAAGFGEDLSAHRRWFPAKRDASGTKDCA